MGRQKLGDFIRKIDYLGAKDEYEDSDDNPGNQLIDFEDKCTSNEDFTFEELKDGYAAFKTKVCIPNFQGRGSPPHDVGYSTVCVLQRLTREFEDEEKHKKETGHLMVYTWLALLTAGPSSGQLDLMSNFVDDSFEEYIQSCTKKELVSILASMKIQLRYDPKDTLEESTYGSLLNDRIEEFFKKLTEEQCLQIQVEFLELYMHYQTQMTELPPEMVTYVGYLVRDMGDQFPDRNPYLKLQDEKIYSSHISKITDMLMKVDGNLGDYRMEDTLNKIFEAALDGGKVQVLFPNIMENIVRFAKKDKTQEQRDRIFDVYRLRVFRQFEEHSIIPDEKMFDSCVQMMCTLMSEVTMEPAIGKMIEAAHCECFMKLTKLGPPQVQTILTTTNVMLQTGRKLFVQMANETIENRAFVKAFVWKNMFPQATLLMDTVGKIPGEKIEEGCVKLYEDFTEELLEQLRKSKVVSKLQKEVLDLIFNCLKISSPTKADIADEAANDKYLTLSIKSDSALMDEVLDKIDVLLKDPDVEWDNVSSAAAQTTLEAVVDAYNGNGKAVTPEQNKKFISIFKWALAGNSIDDHLFPPGIEEYHRTVHFRILQTVIILYLSLHQNSSTIECCAAIFSEILHWAKVSVEEDHDDVQSVSFSCLVILGIAAPKSLSEHLPMIVELFINTERKSEIFGLINSLYSQNPSAVHDRLQDMFDAIDDMTESDKSLVTNIFFTVAQSHPEVFTQKQIQKMIDICAKTDASGKQMYLNILRAIAEKCPKNLVDHFPKLIDDSIFPPDTLLYRATMLGCVGAVNERLSHMTIDYLMKYITYSDPNVQNIVVGQFVLTAKTNTEYMQKYRSKFEALENSTTVPHVRENCHSIILILDGKSIEDVYEDVQQVQDDVAELDTKVDVTVKTVITIGDKVVEQSKDISGMQKEIDVLDDRVDDVEEDLGETKIKVEEIDNKTMTNAPKWSRDLTKLMNPKHEYDWRLLASRLGYSNDDIRGWAQQHDPCMALLSEWYATHKTSEANFAVLTILQEMNRQDGVAIMENAMKAAEGVVEDEEFEYPSPPPIFLSYQWGVQEEVKLLKQHLNMAGFECWMDIGQMGGGDKLFAKIDNGIRAAKVVISCTTEKYAQSPNCNREVGLSVNLNKPIIPLLMEKMAWPPKGSMGPVFSEFLFIRFFQRSGEETKDQRYWPLPKFQELLMQLNFYVVPDPKLIQKEYKSWWTPVEEEIKIDKNKGKSTSSSTGGNNTQVQTKEDESPLVFLSYQWGKQPQIKILYQRLVSLGYTVWMDIYQMGGGDSLYDKIDRGMRGCKAVVSIVTPKYSLSANCRREVSLADALKKPIIPLLLEHMKWPPDGPMSLVFTELLYINFYRNQEEQMVWKSEKFDELVAKLQGHVPEIQVSGYNNKAEAPKAKEDPKEDPKEEPKTEQDTSDTKQRRGMIIKFEEPAANDTPKPESQSKTEKPKSKSCVLI